MERRPFLQLVAGLAVETVGPAGSLGDRREGDASVASVETVRAFDRVVRLNDLGDDPEGTLTPMSVLSQREREVATAAVEEGYETGDPPEWLRRFAGSTPFVEYRDDCYRLDTTFPTYRITAERASAGDVGGRIATYDRYRRAVTREEYAATRLLGLARRGGVELHYAWPALRRFLDAYDAVRYRGGLLAFSVAVADAGPPYRIAGTRVPVTAAIDGAVWNADAAPASVTDFLRAAERAPGAYGFERAPAGVIERLRTHEYVRLDGTFYAASVESGEAPISAAASVRDGHLRLAVRNDGGGDLQIAAGPPRPFGVLRCHPANDPSTSRVLWADAYAESDRVTTTGRAVTAVDDAALLTRVGPGESAAESYVIPADLSPGEYVVERSLDVEKSDGRSPLHVRVVLSVA